jgi:hypothetical protein
MCTCAAGQHRFEIFDREGKFGKEVTDLLLASGLKPTRTSAACPWQNVPFYIDKKQPVASLDCEDRHHLYTPLHLLGENLQHWLWRSNRATFNQNHFRHRCV